MHFESKLIRNLMGNLVKDMGKMVGLDTGDRKITNLIIIKRSLVASVVLRIVVLLIYQIHRADVRFSVTLYRVFNERCIFKIHKSSLMGQMLYIAQYSCHNPNTTSTHPNLT